MQARKSAVKISNLDLKPMRKDTRSPKQEQSVAQQNGPWSRQKKTLMVTVTEIASKGVNIPLVY